MAENRVTQDTLVFSGTPTTVNDRVTQDILTFSGSPTVVNDRVTQLILVFSGLAGKPVTQTATFTNTNSFPSGGDVAHVYGIPVDQDTTFTNTNSFPSGGSIDNQIELVGTATVPSGATVETSGVLVGLPMVGTVTIPSTAGASGTGLIGTGLLLVGAVTVPSGAAMGAGGTLAYGLPLTGGITVPSTASAGGTGLIGTGLFLVGSTTVPSGAAVNSGGLAEIGLFTITLPPVSILGLMDLGAVQLSQVVPFTLTPFSIEGDFTLIPASTASVRPGGLVGSGTYLTGGSTVASTASVTAGGAVGGLGLIGLSTPLSGATVPVPGDVHLFTGLFILGSFEIPSTASVIVPGTLTSAVFNFVGTATIPSGATVYPLGIVNAGGGIYTPFQKAPGMWSGFGQRSMPVLAVNQFDVELLNERANLRRLLRGVERSAVAEERAARGALGGLGEETGPDFRPVSCHKVNLRKNLFERGKLLTPADGGAADHTVLEFWVPTGYHCSVLAYYALYAGTGFVQGSGDIFWRLRVGNAWARNMGNLPYAMGNSSGTITLGTAIQLASGDRVRFQVSVPNTSGLIQVGASYILCGVQGWLYPGGSWDRPSEGR